MDTALIYIPHPQSSVKPLAFSLWFINSKVPLTWCAYKCNRYCIAIVYTLPMITLMYIFDYIYVNLNKSLVFNLLFIQCIKFANKTTERQGRIMTPSMPTNSC